MPVEVSKIKNTPQKSRDVPLLFIAEIVELLD